MGFVGFWVPVERFMVWGLYRRIYRIRVEISSLGQFRV